MVVRQRTKAMENEGEQPARVRRPRATEGRQIVEVPLEKIHRHPHNRTIDPATCADLAASLDRRGLLQPVRVRAAAEDGDLPVGHYQLIDGERRVLAARAAGWESIAAEVVACSDEEAEAEIAAANGQRQELNDIQRADRLAWLQRPVAEGGAGMTQSQAAAEIGIAQPTASLLQAVARLPECWREAVIAGEIAASSLRPVARYADCPAVLRLLWEEYQRDARSKDETCQANWATRQMIEATVADVLSTRTRPLTAGDILDDGEWARPHFEAGELTSAQVRSLQVIEIPGNGRTVRRCLAVEAWRKLDQQCRSAADGHGNGARSAAEPRAKSSPKSKLSAAEVRQQEADQDRHLRDRIQGWQGLASIGLRLALREQLQPGHWITGWLHDELIATARDSEAAASSHYELWRYLAQRLLRAERSMLKGQAPPKIAGYQDGPSYSAYCLGTLDADGDPVTDLERIQWHTVRLLLWPQSGVIEERGRLATAGDWPERMPLILEEVLCKWAALAGATLRQTWEAARAKTLGSPARLWLTKVIATHNTSRQRLELCSELGVPAAAADRMQDLADRIVAQHVERGLKMPAILDWPGKKKRGRK